MAADPLAPLRKPFLERLEAPFGWSLVAFRAHRLSLAVGLALVPGAVLAALAFLPGGMGAEAVAPPGVTALFARLVTGVAAASSIAVSLAAIVFRRELRGIPSLEAHAHANLRFREDVRSGSGRRHLPLTVAGFVQVTLESVREGARAVRASATEEELRAEVDGVTLAAYLAALEVQAEVVRRKLEVVKAKPRNVLEASLDFEQETAAQFARRFGRHEALAPAARGAVARLVGRLDDCLVATLYARTIIMEWTLSGMALVILMTTIPSLLVSSAMVVAYDPTLVATVGIVGAAVVVGAAYALTLLPITSLISYLLHIVFLNAYTLPTAGFILGPESLDVERTEGAPGG